MSRRATIAALLLLGASPAVASAQDTTRKADTAQKLPTATVKEVALNLPETYLRRSRIKGTGKFLTSKDIERIDPPHTPNLLARVSGGDKIGRAHV